MIVAMFEVRPISEKPIGNTIQSTPTTAPTAATASVGPSLREFYRSSNSNRVTVLE